MIYGDTHAQVVPVGGEVSPDEPELEILEPVNGSVVILRGAVVCV